MSGQDLFNALARILVRKDVEVLLAGLCDESIRELSVHIAEENEAEGDDAWLCGMVVMEGWCRFTQQGNE